LQFVTKFVIIIQNKTRGRTSKYHWLDNQEEIFAIFER